jgi:hypothetical protein
MTFMDLMFGFKPIVFAGSFKEPQRESLFLRAGALTYESVEILGPAALPWILASAKARKAVPTSAAISAKRATQTNTKINATLLGARHKGS